MGEVCTTLSATSVWASSNLQPITCAEWCETGDGHADELHEEDQYCSSPAQTVDLVRQPRLMGATKGSWVLDYLEAHLMRERFRRESIIEIGHAGIDVAQLTPDEAERFGRILIELARTARA